MTHIEEVDEQEPRSSQELLSPESKSTAAREVMALGVHGDIQPVLPRTYGEAFRMAQGIVHSGLAPESYKGDVQQVTIGILTSLELGVPPLQGLAGIYIVNGRPTVWGDLLVALVQSKGLIDKMETVWSGADWDGNPTSNSPVDYTCTVRIWRKNQAAPYVSSFSIGDAKRAGLWLHPKKKPWLQSPKRMLFNRARAFALRDGFADCLKGLAITEEAQDLPAKEAAPVSAAFLEDNSTAPSPPAATAEGPETAPATTPASPVAGAVQEHQEGPDEAKADIDGYISALPSVATAKALEAMDTEVRAFLKERDRADLQGAWNAAKLGREKQIKALKT